MCDSPQSTGRDRPGKRPARPAGLFLAFVFFGAPPGGRRQVGIAHPPGAAGLAGAKPQRRRPRPLGLFMPCLQSGYQRFIGPPLFRHIPVLCYIHRRETEPIPIDLGFYILLYKMR